MERDLVLGRERREIMVSERDLECLDLIEGWDYDKEGPFSYDRNSRRFIQSESGQFYKLRLKNRGVYVLEA